METVFMEEKAFDTFVREQKVLQRAKIIGIDGFMRWVITKDDGTEYIVRPQVNE